MHQYRSSKNKFNIPVLRLIFPDPPHQRNNIISINISPVTPYYAMQTHEPRFPAQGLERLPPTHTHTHTHHIHENHTRPRRTKEPLTAGEIRIVLRAALTTLRAQNERTKMKGNRETVRQTGEKPRIRRLLR